MSDLLLGFLFYVSLIVVTLLLVVINRRLIYWRQRGISHNRPKLLFGNLLGRHGKQSLHELLGETYEYFRRTCEPFCGVFFYIEPVTLILNKALALRLLTTDKESFEVTSPKYNLAVKFKFDQNIISNFIHEGEEREIGNIFDVYQACLRCFGIDAPARLQRFRYHKFSYAFKQCYPKYFHNETENETRAISCDVSSTLLSFVLLELARKPVLQQKCHSEAVKALQRYENHFEKEALNDLSLLSSIIKELWQRHTFFSHLTLRALKHYETHCAGYDINQGQLIAIPIAAMDSKDLELTYLAFGNSDVQLQTTLTLALLLKHYQFLTCDTTPYEISLRETLPHRSFHGTIDLRVEKR